MYLQSDLFAIGCLFWKMYFGKKPPWSTLSKKEFHLVDLQKLQLHYACTIENARKAAFQLLEKTKEQHERCFLEVILQMTHPNPKERGQASEIKKKLFTC